jgi:hypothetical protein
MAESNWRPVLVFQEAPGVIDQADSNRSFGEMHFGKAQLGDQRRTDRLAYSADCIRRHPGSTLPDKFKAPADLKAFYRLCDCEAVTHEAVLKPHREYVLEQIAVRDGDVLVIHDSTELDYSTHFALQGLGQIGNGHHKGYVCHNSLAVAADTREVLGLLNQILHHRARVAKNETHKQRRERQSRESRLWSEGVTPLPRRPQFIDVCDQGADVFEFLAAEMASGRRFVVRSAYDRTILVGHDGANNQADHLRTYTSTLSKLGELTVKVTRQREEKSPKKKGKKTVSMRQAREANLHVAAAAVRIYPPGKKSGEYANEPLPMWVIRVWEANPPEGQAPLEWFLLTNEPVASFEDACRVTKWYECRWIIEEYHKALKTGCGIENPQFETEDRLQPAIALLSVVALTLLSLRDASRRPDAKERPATDVVDSEYVEVLSIWRHRQAIPHWSVHEFFLALGRLGGHQNRKCDGEPGWLVLWRGWTTLQAMLEGARAMKISKKCG